MFDLFKKASEEFPEDGDEETSISSIEALKNIKAMEDGPDKVRAMAEFMIAYADSFSVGQINFLLNSEITIQTENDVPIENNLYYVLSNSWIAGLLNTFGIKTLEDISLYCPKDVISGLRGLGKNSLDNISTSLRLAGLEFAPNLPIEEENRTFVLYNRYLHDEELKQSLEFLCKENFRTIQDLSVISESEFNLKLDRYTINLVGDAHSKVIRESQVSKIKVKNPLTLQDHLMSFFGFQQNEVTIQFDRLIYDNLVAKEKSKIKEQTRSVTINLMKRFEVEFKPEKEA